ncbi:MAG TPA: molybdate ABC transporter substrate-binding protein [Syntrophorhabdaceae bacterium]|jgi:molybdate transport system substrate-binding protein
MGGLKSFSLFFLGFILLFTSCVGAEEINLSVAASLREAVSALAGGFEKKNPGIRFQSNFGGSGTLAKQVENGAPCDLFFSANTEWVDFLKEKGLVDGKNVFLFAFNELVFVAGPESGVKNIKDVVKLERILPSGARKAFLPVNMPWKPLKKPAFTGSSKGSWSWHGT